ncbi:hypothetical protein [Deinococcus sp. Marseille-Q6407]|uniref:hypothetical protein n=1 Tax=Deinococcus sp. Marseille-Q6407 TaxID=2969223 RepID=UPI0021BF195C|nr:hypothetical protein [Deinococcus sp. Marseille-Q6407]
MIHQRAHRLAAALTLLPLAGALGGCTDSSARTPVVSVTNTTPEVVGPVAVDLGGTTVDFGQLRSGEKRRIGYRPQQASEVVVRWNGRHDLLQRSIVASGPEALGNDVNILLKSQGAVLDPGKNHTQN